MRRGRRNQKLKATVSGVVVLAALSAGGWWLWGREAAGRAHASDADAAAPTPHDLAMAMPEIEAEPPLPVVVLGSAQTEGNSQDQPEPTETSGDIARVSDARPADPPSAAGKDEVLEPRGGSLAEGMDTSAARAEAAPASSPALAQASPQPARPQPAPASAPSRSSNPAIQEALKRYQAGQVLEARHELNRLLHSSLPEADKDEIRAHLSRIAGETILSRRRLPNDPLVETYTVQRGDKLVHVARRYDIPHEAIMLVNEIRDPSRIAEGMKLAVPRGPFHARIYKSRFRLDLYLQDLYLRSFPVGLGVDSGTPTGTWRVKNRQPNPTYYPPASAADRRVIPPNDPRNPLGEYWIGLEGVDGEALGRDGYGIHGTIEPETIGRNASLGCVRMREEDVALLFRVLQVGKSTVTIYP